MDNSKSKLRILFISRAFPPVMGGVEMQNYGISKALSSLATVTLLANKKGKKFLPAFLPIALLKSIFLFQKHDAVILGDGVLSPLGVILKLFYPKKKVICIIHGLDVTFALKNSLLGRIYKAINIPSQKKMDKLIMVGNETLREAEKAGIPRKKCVFIPNGFDPNEIYQEHSRKELEKLLGMNLNEKKVIFRGGRFVKHKGVEWFIRNVMPQLPEHYIFVAAGGIVFSKIAGDKNEYPSMKKATEEIRLTQRVKLLGNLSRADMKILFNTADLYVSPNIKVPGSMEGFGINAIEGAGCKKVVLASNLEGLKDAVQEGKNGFLLPPEDAGVWIKKIIELLSNDKYRKKFGEKARQFVIDNYSWSNIAKKYLEVIEKT